jgi:hypothetical protein
MNRAEADETLSIDGYQVHVTHPDKLYFSKEVQLTNSTWCVITLQSHPAL